MLCDDCAEMSISESGRHKTSEGIVPRENFSPSVRHGTSEGIVPQENTSTSVRHDTSDGIVPRENTAASVRRETSNGIVPRENSSTNIRRETSEEIDPRENISTNVRRETSEEIVPREMPDLSARDADVQMKTMYDRRVFMYNRLKKQMDSVERLLQLTNVEMVNQEMVNLDQMLNGLVEMNMQYVTLLSSEEAEAAMTWMSSVDDEVFAMKRRVCEWMQWQERDNYSDRKSRTSRSSSRTSRSSRSRSSGNSAQSQAIHNKAKLAGLKAKLAIAEENVQKDIERKIARMRRVEGEKIESSLRDLREQIVECEAAEHVYNEVGCVPKSTEEKFLPALPSDQSRTRFDVKDNPLAESSSRHSSDHTDLSKLNEAMVDMLNLHAAPNADIDVFNGDPLEFHYFRALFRDVVENKVSDQRGRLMRLIKYTSGEPKELIKGFVHSDSRHCFDEAMSTLADEYGNPSRISSAYLKELRNWPLIKHGDSRAYRSFCHFLKRCNVLKTQGQLCVLDSVDSIRSVVGKFPSQVQESWNRKSLNIKTKQCRESDFSDLVKFVEEQNRLVNNPEYSREAFFETKTGVAKVKSFLVGHPKAHCYFCDSNHPLEICQDFAQLNLEDRQKFVKERRLCFGCLNPTNPKHFSKICEQRMVCEICDGGHPTLLHEEAAQHVSVAHTEASGTCGNVVNLSVVPVKIWHEDDPSNVRSVYALLDECSQGNIH